MVWFCGSVLFVWESFYILERLWFYGSGLRFLEVGWFSESALGSTKVVSVWWISYVFACVLVFCKCFLFSGSALVLWKCLGFCGSLYGFLEEFWVFWKCFRFLKCFGFSESLLGFPEVFWVFWTCFRFLEVFTVFSKCLAFAEVLWVFWKSFKISGRVSVFSVLQVF